MIKPWQILIFLLSILLMLFLISYTLNGKKIKIYNDISLSFPEYKNIFQKKQYADISEIIDVNIDMPNEQILKKDTIKQENTKDTTQSFKKEKKITELEYSEEGKILLFNFLDGIRKSKKTVHILHYGDSQIEGDRITGYLRHKFQNKYDGTGNGLMAAFKLVESFAVEQNVIGNWKRYNIFGRRDSSVKHRNYGVMGTFSRFAPVKLAKDTPIYEASIKFNRSPIAYKNDRYYNKIRLFYGNTSEPVLTEIYADGKLIKLEKLKTGKGTYVKEWQTRKYPKTLEIKFTGKDSPDIYGISLENTKGVVVDNIPMRGAAGTDFTKISYNSFERMFNMLNVKMVILEYGGNAIPFIKNEKQIKIYGKMFYRQLIRFKKLNKKMPVIVIGPADMSKKIDGKFVTYPLLENLIAEMRSQTHKAGYIFWDMYLAMGGKNSMPAWVNSKPQLAAKDYIHFTSRGAKIIAEKFYEALEYAIKDYSEIKEKNIEYAL